MNIKIPDKLKQFLIDMFGFNLFNDWEQVKFDGTWVQYKHRQTGETMDCIRGNAMRYHSTMKPPIWITDERNDR